MKQAILDKKSEESSARKEKTVELENAIEETKSE